MTYTGTDYTQFEPETEAKVKIDEWGGIIVPCDILGVFNSEGKPITNPEQINKNCTARIRFYVGSAEALKHKPVKFEYTVKVGNLY